MGAGSKMNKIMVAVGIAFLGYTLGGGNTMAETINFEADPVGTAPSGWSVGVTGRGSFRWTVEADASAPSKSKVLKQERARRLSVVRPCEHLNR
jgi:hypothetical protein